MSDTAAPLLDVRDVKVWYPTRGGMLQRVTGQIRAVDGVSLDVRPGETLGLVGESGCGKSTLGRALVRLQELTEGRIQFNGEDVGKESRRKFARQVQMIFQDPVGSLNPRMRIGDIIGEGLAIHGIGSKSERQATIANIVKHVGLRPDVVNRFPHEFSGGQRQRIGIARALVLRPQLIVADEPVSALDVSIQSQMLNLLVELKRDFDLAYVFVAHNLAVVAYISDRIAVMYLGKIVEIAPSRAVYERPLHPYTTALISAIPEVRSRQGSKRIVLQGDVPSPLNPPSGCRFRTRCPVAREICREVEPALTTTERNHSVACHFPGELTL